MENTEVRGNEVVLDDLLVVSSSPHIRSKDVYKRQVEEWLKDPNISYHGDKLDNIPFGETKNYVEKVMNTYKTYKLFYENELPNQAEFDNPISLIWNNYKAFVKDIIKSF